MQIGGLDPIKPDELKNPVIKGTELTEAEKQLQQIKWILVALIVIMILKKK
jgi:hypothetical protein